LKWHFFAHSFPKARTRRLSIWVRNIEGWYIELKAPISMVFFGAGTSSWPTLAAMRKKKKEKKYKITFQIVKTLIKWLKQLFSISLSF
jgi:hypothetical protein